MNFEDKFVNNFHDKNLIGVYVSLLIYFKDIQLCGGSGTAHNLSELDISIWVKLCIFCETPNKKEGG